MELADKDVYDKAVDLWVYAKECFTIVDQMLTPKNKLKSCMSQKPGVLKRMWSMFWAGHQRFFKYLTIAAKIPQCVAMVKQAKIDGSCIVIGLQSTGESRTTDHFEKKESNEDDDFLSTTA